MKYWHNMPEIRAIPLMIQTVTSRVDGMIARPSAPTVKRNPQKAVAAMSHQNPASLAELNHIIAKSEPLVPGATQAVLGEGPAHAHVVFVGEQPGDQEDVQGRPFVGPAGQLLRRAINEAGMDDSEMYFTNAVKHFKFVLRGKRRIHQTPTAGEVKHYRWWLLKEVALIKPRLVVALGATASRALKGKAVSVTKERGTAEFDGHPGYITVHPSYLLRIPEERARQKAYEDFLDDLAAVRDLAA
jgi:DNA polymerase